MRQYPLTESELTVIGNAGAASAACFSIGGGLIGFGANLYKDTKIQQTNLNPNQIVAVNVVNSGSLIAGVSFLVVGALLFLYGRRTLDRIKASTSFDDGQGAFVLPRWPKITLVAASLIVLLLVGFFIGIFYRG